MRTFGKPMLPRGLLRELIELKAPTPVYDPDNGGQWVSGKAEEVPFQGCADGIRRGLAEGGSGDLYQRQPEDLHQRPRPEHWRPGV